MDKMKEPNGNTKLEKISNIIRFCFYIGRMNPNEAYLPKIVSFLPRFRHKHLTSFPECCFQFFSLVNDIRLQQCSTIFDFTKLKWKIK